MMVTMSVLLYRSWTDLQMPSLKSGCKETLRRLRLRRRRECRLHLLRFSLVWGKLVEALPVTRIWILLDEWAAIPMDLQPYLADLLRRAVFPVRGMVVKIAAIEQRARFSLPGAESDYVGIEVGADAAADLDLDDFMVFGNDPEAAKKFFRELLFRHVRAEMQEEGLEPPSDGRHFSAGGVHSAECVRRAGTRCRGCST